MFSKSCIPRNAAFHTKLASYCCTDFWQSPEVSHTRRAPQSIMLAQMTRQNQITTDRFKPALHICIATRKAVLLRRRGCVFVNCGAVYDFRASYDARIAWYNTVLRFSDGKDSRQQLLYTCALHLVNTFSGDALTVSSRAVKHFTIFALHTTRALHG